MLLMTRKKEQIMFAIEGRYFNAITLNYRLQNARRMNATILFTTSAKATENGVMATPTQLHVIASAIIPTIQAMETFFGMMNF